MSVASNDNTKLTPRTESGGRKLKFELPGVRIGCAEYDEGPTGCTVFHFPSKPAFAVADIRGGAHCSMFMDYLADGGGGVVDAICLAGGSFYGLETSAGVAAELFAQRGFDRAFRNIALVSGAIIYDFRPRDNAIYPDKDLGRAALRSAKENEFPLGPRGAGRSATCGKWQQKDYRWEPAGQGAAFAQIGDTRILCCTVVNSVGAIIDRGGRVVRGNLNTKTETRDRVVEMLNRAATPARSSKAAQGNTTLSVVITNRKLDACALQQFARQVHTSMARCIDPFHTSSDGDILYAVTTNEVGGAEPGVDRMGVVASEAMWDAVLSCYDP